MDIVDREWPAIDAEWSQWDLHAYARMMGMNVDPSETVPQGLKYVQWPPEPLTEEEIEWGRQIAKRLEAGELKTIAVIPRRRDARRN